MKIVKKVLSALLKCIAAVVAVCLFFGLLAACITGSLLAVDLVRKRGGETYAGVESKAVSWLQGKLEGGQHLTDAQQRQYLSEHLGDMRQRQLEVDEMLLAELHSGAYSFDQPMLVNNPYGISPLTAVLLFTTEQPEIISIHIEGDTPLAAVDYTFDGYGTEHIIPVYGLYAGRENAVTLTARTEAGAERTAALSIATDALPDSLAHETVRAYALDASAVQPGFTFTYRGNNMQITRAALDVNGDYRWCLDLKGGDALLGYAQYCGNYNGGNSVFIAVGSLDYGVVDILEFNLLGKLLNAWYSPYGAHHDIEIDGDTLWVTGSVDSGTKESLLYALDMTTGEITHTLDYADILQPYRDQAQFYTGERVFYELSDWCHMNSVTTCGDDLIISSRHQSTVVCNDRDGNIKWMLCDPADYFAHFQRYILRPVGDNFTYFYTQHAAEVMPDQDGDPDTVDILLFDNGDFRVADAEKASRMVQYRVNAREMTVEQIWSWGDDCHELYSYRHGDADLLPNGNRLGSFEPYDEKADLRYAYGVEVDADGNVVWECWRTSDDAAHEYGEYRLERLEIYAEAANDLRLGTPANLFLPET